MKPNQPTSTGILISVIIVLLLMCLCCAGGLALALILFNTAGPAQAVVPLPADHRLEESQRPTDVPFVVPTWWPPTPAPTAELAQPTQPAAPAELPTPALAPAGAADTLRVLEQAQVPQADPLDLARRLQGIANIPPTLSPPLVQPSVGSRQNFWVTNSDSDENFEVAAELRSVTDHLYFWVEEGVEFRQREIDKLVEIFETQIYPTNRQFSGSEWTPGVDGDPRLHALYAGNMGFGVAGYFSSADELPPQVNEYSNAKEMFFINADIVDLSDEFILGVLAHEFQHMISWNQDRNEDVWFDEGLADLAAFINGFESGDYVRYYLAQPDIPLTNWPGEADLDHYGASFHFLAYFMHQFGQQTAMKLAVHPANGMDSIDQVLAESDLRDPVTDELLTADQFFADWAVENYLQEAGLPYLRGGNPVATETIRTCDGEPQPMQVYQYGIDYLELRCRGSFTLRLTGDAATKLVAGDPHSGEFAAWSNTGGEADTTLTREFDFTNHTGPLTLEYWTWYDIEEDYDYAYVSSSVDGGESWQILTTPGGTAEDPTGASFGWAYTGTSGWQDGRPSWVQEQVDISDLAGQKALIRFEYVTDGAVNGDGLLVDDIAIPEIGYFTDFEAGEDGWEAAGFARIQNALPQTFRVSVIEMGDTPQVTQFNLAGDNLLEIPLEIGQRGKEIILVVSGTTRITQQPASYTLQLLPR